MYCIVSHPVLFLFSLRDVENSSIDVRSEWCKARARAQRWTEEVALLEEEKRRSLVSLEHQAQLWEGTCYARSREPAPSPNDDAMHPALDEGLVAYASRQANMYRQIAKGFVLHWAEKTKGEDKDKDKDEVEESLEEPVIDETAAEDDDLYALADI